MDNRGGGGGRTPRGRKARGGGRGRGHGDSPRTQSTQQSPTVSSSAVASQSSSLSMATPPPRGIDTTTDDKSKVTADSASQPASTTVSASATSEMSSATEQESAQKEEPMPTTPHAKDSEKVDVQDVDKKEELSAPPPTLPEKLEDEKDKLAATVTSPTSVDSLTEFKTPLKELQPPELPPAVMEEDIGTTEAKVSEALGKSQHPVSTAKTLVVTPTKDLERSTDAPLVVEISTNAATCAGDSANGEQRPSSSASQPPPSRAGSLSPAVYGYALRGPVGKPGYIGGVGFSDEEGDTPGRKHSAIARRESAIAAVETAVKGFSRRQWILLFMFGLIDLLSAITISLQAPFFPAEAERKGATASEYGFVFGIFEFVVFLMSPLYGKYMNKLGPKLVFSVCIFVTSVSVICFGLLDRINDHTWFITLCFVCRICEALGCAGFFTATFVIIASEFPESVATTFASLETFFGLGLIVGPTVGGALYDVGGFPLPFFVVGASLLLAAVLSSFVMPKIDKVTDEDGQEQSGYGVWTILKIPSVALAAASIASTSMSLGFVSATLEPHIRKFGLTPLQTGLVFVVNGGLYALSAPIWGFICDYIKRPVYITILGNMFIFVSFLFIGPAAFMPFDTILWVTIVGLVIQGLGFGCCLVSGFIVGLRDSLKYGLPDNMATYGVASGLWTSMISLGAFIGPTAAGVLFDNVGFRVGSYLILATALVVGISNLIHTCCTTGESESNTDSETQPLLRPVSPVIGMKDVESAALKDVQPSTSSYGTT